MREAASLRALERRMFARFTAPAGAELRDVERDVRGDERLDAEGRARIYARMYFARLHEVLGAVYPALAKTIGDDEFERLARDYLAASPSRHPSLRELGAGLPAFLLMAGVEEHADLARLEWARYDVFDAADAPLVTLDELRALDGAAFAELRLTLAPAHRLVVLDHRADLLWRAAQSDAAPPVLDRAPCTLLVWRRGAGVFHRVLAPIEGALLRQAASGVRFDFVCEQLASAYGTERATHEALALLSTWIRDELLRR